MNINAIFSKKYLNINFKKHIKHMHGGQVNFIPEIQE